MNIGIEVPQGWKGEYAGWEPAAAWRRTVELAAQAEHLGFESLWVADHFHTKPEARLEITFESFVVLAALAPETRRIRLGHLVACAGFRNPALVAKMAGTLDVICDGRYELGLGAGWKEDEWRAYGYGFPPLRERLEDLEDQLGLISLMLRQDVATYHGGRHSVDGAINVPRGLQSPRVPIIVGGNGRKFTRRLAIRHADEINLVELGLEALRIEMADIAGQCENAGRDPASLRISLFLDERDLLLEDHARQDLLAGYAASGLDRLITFPMMWDISLESLPRFAEDCLSAGIALTSA